LYPSSSSCTHLVKSRGLCIISFSVLHPQPRNHVQRQTHKQPNRTKNHKNRYQHRIRKRKVSGLIIQLQQQYPKEHPNNKRNDTFFLKKEPVLRKELFCFAKNKGFCSPYRLFERKVFSSVYHHRFSRDNNIGLKSFFSTLLAIQTLINQPILC
jgi:hypothetical protein